MSRNYVLTEEEAKLAWQQISDHCEAIKNWIAGAVERKDFEYAERLTKDLRTHQRLYARLNVEAHKVIDKNSPRQSNEKASDRDLASYIERVGQLCGPEYHHHFLGCMQSVVIDFRAGRDAESLAKEIQEHG